MYMYGGMVIGVEHKSEAENYKYCWHNYFCVQHFYVYTNKSLNCCAKRHLERNVLCYIKVKHLLQSVNLLARILALVAALGGVDTVRGGSWRELSQLVIYTHSKQHTLFMRIFDTLFSDQHSP